MTKAQQTYERVNALVDGGMQKAAAFKQLAEEYGQPVDSVRGAYYGHKRVVETGGQPGTGRSGVRRSRKRETTTQDAIASAVATLRSAIDSIEIELEAARERAERSPGRVRGHAGGDRPAGSRRSGPRSPCWIRRRPSRRLRPRRPRRSRARSGPNEDWWHGTRG